MEGRGGWTRVRTLVQKGLDSFLFVRPKFPTYLRTVRAGDRATEFKQRLGGTGFEMRIPGAVRPASFGAQFQSSASRLLETRRSHRAVPG